MTTEARLDLEREWIAASVERDDLRAAVGAARQSGDDEALAAARLRLKQATNRCNEVMSRYQRVAGIPPKPARPPDTSKADAVRGIVEDLDGLIGKADRVGLTVVARTIAAARDAARRVIEPGETGEKAG